MMRYPDDSEIPSVVYREITRKIMTTTAAGHAGMWFVPGRLNSSVNTATVFTGDTASTITAANSTNYTTLEANFSEYRVTAAEIEIRYIHSSLENQGRSAIKFFTSGSGDLTTVPADIPLTYGSSALREQYGALKENASVIVPPKDLSRRIFASTSTAAASNSYNFPGVAIIVAGGQASTDVLEIVMRQDIEFIPDCSNWVARTASEAASPDPNLRGTLNKAYHNLHDTGMDISFTKGDPAGNIYKALCDAVQSPIVGNVARTLSYLADTSGVGLSDFAGLLL